MSKIRLIEGSLTCYACGWISLVPVLGLPAAFIALTEFRALREIKEWNPAQKYLRAGVWLALLGLLVNGLASLLLVLYILALIQNGTITLDKLFI